MLDALSIPAQVIIFLISAGAVWLAGTRLSDATDVLSSRWGMGEALGGLVLLAIVTNLPELAITASGALRHDLGIAIGNILGGIAIQTVVLVLLDVFGSGKSAPLTYRAASLSLVLEGTLVMAILGIAIVGTQLPSSLVFARVAPPGILITLLWVAGLWLVGKSRTDLPWQDRGQAPDGQDKPRGHAEKQKEQAASIKKISTARTLTVFCISAGVTLICGILLEMTGDAIAKHFGMSGMLFGATVLAAATALPEVSTGLASVRLGDYQLAISDIFGGNAFLPVLFLLASLLSGEAVLPHAQATDIYMTGLGMLLTAVYVTGLIFRPRIKVAGMGVDSFIVLILYVLGILGLVAITS